MCVNLQKVKVHDHYKKYRGVLVHAYNGYQLLPCGKCYECAEQKIEEWLIRWQNQLTESVPDSSYMLTLTYSEEHVPLMVNEDGEYITTLDYSDVQKFLKRLRKYQDKYCKTNKIENPKIYYHCCGEYGKRFTKRPHYHMLITNVIIPPENIERIWKLGKVHVGKEVSDKTIKYVLKYTLKNSLENQNLKIKKVYDEIVHHVIKGDAFQHKYPIELYKKIGVNVHNPQIIETEIIIKKKLKYKVYLNGKNANRVVEKTLCSKGIGKNWLTEKNIKLYQENPRLNYLYYDATKEKYKEKPLPRYYKEAIFNPKKRDENGKLIKDENGRYISLWSPLEPEFENSPRFKKQLIAFERSQRHIQILISLHGVEGLFEKHKIDLISNERNIERFNKRLILQDDKNYKAGVAHLI